MRQHPFWGWQASAGCAQIARMRRAAAGFTLVELVITLALAATLVALASPGFGALRDEWALRAATHAVLGGLAEARLAALSRGSQGSLCPSADGLRCGSSGTTFLVRAGPSDEATLRVSTLPQGVTLRGNRTAATYYAWPAAALPVTLTLCAVRKRTHSRLVIVSQTGRPRVEKAGHC